MRPHLFACPEILPVALTVRDLKQVRWDGTPIILAKSVSNIVTTRPNCRLVKRSGVSNKRLHSLAVWRQNLAHICLRPLALRKPPNCIYRVLCTELALVYPLDWGRQFRRIVPVKVLRKFEAEVIAELEQNPKRIQRPLRRTLDVSSANIHNE